MKQQADLGNGSIGRLLFQMAIPTIIAQVVNALYNIVDRIYIGHIPEVGATALTGVGLTFPLIMIISAFSMLIGMGGAPRVAFKLGEQDQKGAEEIVGNCTASLAVVAVILTVVTLVFAKPLLLAFGGNADTTLPYAVQYINIYAFGTIFVQFVLGLNPFITAQGFSMTSMKTILIGAVTNIVLDPVFIFVFGMGVRGAALATVPVPVRRVGSPVSDRQDNHSPDSEKTSAVQSQGHAAGSRPGDVALYHADHGECAQHQL